MPKPSNGDKIAVWFSCGAASAVAAKLTVEQYGDRCDVHLVRLAGLRTFIPAGCFCDRPLRKGCAMSNWPSTALPEYCAACGGQLGAARRLVRSEITGKYETVHNSEHCAALFFSRNRRDPLAPVDTSNGARLP